MRSAGTGRRIDLVPVVGLDHFDIVAAGEDTGGNIEEPEHRIDTDRHIRREDDRDRLRRLGNFRLARHIDTGRADHNRLAGRDGRLEVGERRFGTGEVNQAVRNRKGFPESTKRSPPRSADRRNRSHRDR